MKLLTNRPITFLPKFLASSYPNNGNDGFTVISINSKNLSLVGDVIATKSGKQKGIGFLYFKKLQQNILQYILVGKDKSVVTIRRMVIPTISILQARCD